MPGVSLPPRLSTSKRACNVRVFALTWGRISLSSPENVCPGSACNAAFTF